MKCSTHAETTAAPAGLRQMFTNSFHSGWYVVPRASLRDVKRHEFSHDRDASWLVCCFIKTSHSQSRFANEISVNEAMRAFRALTWDEASENDFKNRTFIFRVPGHSESVVLITFSESAPSKYFFLQCIVEYCLTDANISLKNIFVFEKYFPWKTKLPQCKNVLVGKNENILIFSEVASANFRRVRVMFH